MKALLRLGFAALIVLGIAIQFTRGRIGDADSDPMATLASGLGQLNVQTDGATAEGVLTGHTPSCDQPLHVMLASIDGAQDEQLRGVRPAMETLKYVYLGSVGETRDRAAMFRRWIWAGIMFTIGLRAAKPRPDFVLVVLPKACPELATLQWTVLSPWS